MSVGFLLILMEIKSSSNANAILTETALYCRQVTGAYFNLTISPRNKLKFTVESPLFKATTFLSLHIQDFLKVLCPYVLLQIQLQLYNDLIVPMQEEHY